MPCATNGHPAKDEARAPSQVARQRLLVAERPRMPSRAKMAPVIRRSHRATPLPPRRVGWGLPTSALLSFYRRIAPGHDSLCGDRARVCGLDRMSAFGCFLACASVALRQSLTS